MQMTADEKKIADEARKYLATHKNDIAKRLTDKNRYQPEKNPVSVFMAGSPGAGKTEASIELIAKFPPDSLIRIDPDELRSEFPGYAGGNAWLFQRTVSALVDRVWTRSTSRSRAFCWTARFRTTRSRAGISSAPSGKSERFRFSMFTSTLVWPGRLS